MDTRNDSENIKNDTGDVRYSHGTMLGRLGRYCCYNNPQSQWRKTTQMYSSLTPQFLEEEEEITLLISYVNTQAQKAATT